MDKLAQPPVDAEGKLSRAADSKNNKELERQHSALPKASQQKSAVAAINSSFKYLVEHRHSTRVFLPRPVPKQLIDESLAIASQAPSGSNIQPWRIHFMADTARDRLVSALMEETDQHPPGIRPIPERFNHFRSEFGHKLYGPDGYNIGRDERERKAATTKRNFEFFGATLAGVICIDSDLDRWDIMSVGMWVQLFLLALEERGLASCLEVSVVGYEGVLRKVIGIGEDQTVLCGLAVGYEDVSAQVNHVVSGREGAWDGITWQEN